MVQSLYFSGEFLQQLELADRYQPQAHCLRAEGLVA
jgi:hypothetical protein